MWLKNQVSMTGMDAKGISEVRQYNTCQAIERMNRNLTQGLLNIPVPIDQM